MGNSERYTSGTFLMKDGGMSSSAHDDNTKTHVGKDLWLVSKTSCPEPPSFHFCKILTKSSRKYQNAIGEEPCNFEPRSSEEERHLKAPQSPNVHTSSQSEDFELREI
ncbi:hypothetical protein TNCV_1366471 [Trichonephila clavipes]|nr:hypothetical protein TNCV_1366471 [Trichonephila clavipes]